MIQLRNIDGAVIYQSNAATIRQAVAEAVSKFVDLTGVDLGGVDLGGAQLQGARMPGANLARAFLVEADLTGSDLSGADMTSADLTRAIVQRAKIDKARLQGVAMRRADLTGTQPTHIRQPGGITPGCNWPEYWDHF